MARVDNTGGSGFTVDNGTGLVVRTKLNQVIGALSTLNQGSGEMSIGVAAYVPHIDGNTLKIRNAANNAFVSLGDVSLANFGHASLSSANTFTARATFSVTSSITLPSGTTAQRDGSPAVGMIRHNSETNTFEGYNNGAWGSLGSGSGGISNVVEDTSPQLGGNLDVQAFELNTSTSNGNIKLNPNGSGTVEIKGDGSSLNGKLQLNCSQNSHGVKLESPDHSASQSYTIKLPDNQIAADKFLKVKSISGSGSTAIGQLEFADGSGGVTSDSQNNTVAGTGAGASFSGTDANNNTLFGKDAGNDITTGDNNVAIGTNALDANTTGGNNTAAGYNALGANTTGDDNNGFGESALAANTTGSDNNAFGVNALVTVTTGSNNCAFGRSALGFTTTASNNSAFGHNALNANTTGTDNVSVGSQALDANTTGTDNTALGRQALTNNTTAGNNTGIGNRSLLGTTTGQQNTSVGSDSLYTNSTGSTNVAVGFMSLYSNTTASNNVAVGMQALLSNTTGASNTAVGSGALDANTTASSITAVGANCLGANTTGGTNTGVGSAALLLNTTGHNNSAMGGGAMFYNTTGYYNSAFGANALYHNTTGYSNTAIGYQCLYDNTTGTNNVAVGALALDANTTANDNTAVGKNSLGANTTGAANTAIGDNSGSSNTTGANNIYLGNDAGTASSPSGAITTDSNTVCIGNNNISNAFIKVAFTVTSDQRDKIEDGVVSHGLDFVNQLKPKSFWFRKNRDSDEKHGDKRYGFYAQDILALEGSDSVIIDSKDSDNLKFKGDQLIPVLVNAIKELSAKVTALEAG